MRTIIVTLFITGLSFQSVNATGLHRCDSGEKSSWQSQQSLKEKLLADGWKVRKIKEDGGCYEVYGTSPEGQRGEAYFHPQTFELELIARRGQILFRKDE